jgi:hypothetical protein
MRYDAPSRGPLVIRAVSRNDIFTTGLALLQSLISMGRNSRVQKQRSFSHHNPADSTNTI